MKKFRRRSTRMNMMHFRVLSKRYFRQIFTNLSTLLPLILEAPVMLIILFITCKEDAFTTKDITQANLIAFMLIVMAAFMGLLNSYREICKEREILSREVYGGLDIPAYVLSKMLVLSVIGIVQCAILFGGSLAFIDFAFAKPLPDFLLCFAAMALTNISVTALGLLISALLKKSESAVLPVLMIIIMQVVFCDCLISLDGGAEILRYITPSAWGIAVFGKVCGLNGWYPDIVSKDLYGLNAFLSLGILAAFAFVFITLTIVILRRVYRQKD